MGSQPNYDTDFSGFLTLISPNFYADFIKFCEDLTDFLLRIEPHF